MPRNFASPAATSRLIPGNVISAANAPISRQQQGRRNLLAHAGEISNGQPAFANNDAQAIPQELLFGKSENAGFLYENSLAAVRKENFDLALRLISRACSLADATGECYRLHAHLLWRQGDRHGATCTARTWVERNSDNALAWDFLGELLVAQNELTESKICYERAIEIDPTLLTSALNLATTLLRLGHTKAAECKYRDILKQQPEHLDASLTWHACSMEQDATPRR